MEQGFFKKFIIEVGEGFKIKIGDYRILSRQRRGSHPAAILNF
jgi:mRNA-degrading endonuclease RelE of RelBE toxin-antitoxin system